MDRTTATSHSGTRGNVSDVNVYNTASPIRKPCAQYTRLDRSIDALKMDQNVGGYDNSACTRNDGGVHTRVAAAIQMEQLDVAACKCCGGGSNRNGSNSSDADVAPNVCQPKCPAVRESPWDPTKTRFAVFLIVAVVLWIIGGVIALKF